MVAPARPAAPGSTAALRTANQRRVLDVLRSRPAPGGPEQEEPGPVTQAELARTTGLAPATVSNIVRDLAQAGLVDTVPGAGRRGTTITLARSAGVVAGIDFGHSHVAVAVGDLTGTPLVEARTRLSSQHGSGEGLDHAAAMLTELLADPAVGGAHLHAVGMGLPAPITDEVVRSAAILPGWVGVNARQVATERFGVPVHVENDANLGALAEHRLGVGRGHDNSVFVKISSGIGAGIIIGNQLFGGATGAAGELGHLTLDEQGPVCRCGSRGCLEAYASTGSVLQMMAGQLPEATFRDVVAAGRDGNMSALRTFEDAGLHLGWGLATVVNLLDPGLVIIGGDMARAGELLLESVRIGLRRHALDAVANTRVAASELGERASLVGAVIVAAERTDLVVG